MTLQDRDYGDEFIMSVMTQWAGSDPQEASKWAATLQEEGWLRPELDPEDIRRRLFTAVFAAGGALLADPSAEEQDRQLAMIDELLASMAPDDA